jgi:hypothetical protein
MPAGPNIPRPRGVEADPRSWPLINEATANQAFQTLAALELVVGARVAQLEAGGRMDSRVKGWICAAGVRRSQPACVTTTPHPALATAPTPR